MRCTPPHSLPALRALCTDLPAGDDAAVTTVERRNALLTKPPGSLGRLELIVRWLARWQHRGSPRMDAVDIVVFAGNHGVTAQRVSAYPASVTAQMVENFAAGGAAINQLAQVAGAKLRVVPLQLDSPTKDFTVQPAMDENEFLGAVSAGFGSVRSGVDLLCVGEMGIGNTTAAAAICAGLFGGGGTLWAGRGTGVDDEGLIRKRMVIDRALECHAALLHDPLYVAMALGGRELAALLGAVVAARLRGIPVLLDGFVCTAAVAPLFVLAENALDHTSVAHASAEAGHVVLLDRLGMKPLLSLEMRLGEGAGAALAIPLVRAAVACHAGMATFAEAGVANRE